MRECGVYKYEIFAQQVDFCGKATLVTMGNYFLSAAGDDAHNNGFGLMELHSHNMAWVLSRMAMEIYRFPVEEEFVTITTWVEEVGRLMTVRNMIMTDQMGEKIAAASTQWAMIDFVSRQPLDLRTNKNYLEVVIPTPSPIQRAERIAVNGGVLLDQIRVRYSDIDLNKHVNSLKYLEWVVDYMPIEFVADRRPVRVDLNYLHETKLGETVEIYAIQEQTSGKFEIKRVSDNQVLCRCAVATI